MPKKKFDSSRKIPGLMDLVTEADIRAAAQLTNSIVLERDDRKFSVISSDPTLIGWAKSRTAELSKIVNLAAADPEGSAIFMKELFQTALLEAFTLAYTLFSKITSISSMNDGSINPGDLLRLELWERGLLDPKFYRFRADDNYLREIKKKHMNVMLLIEKLKRMNATPTAKE